MTVPIFPKQKIAEIIYCWSGLNEEFPSGPNFDELPEIIEHVIKEFAKHAGIKVLEEPCQKLTYDEVKQAANDYGCFDD